MRRLIAALVLLAVAGVGVTGCSGTPQSPRATAPTTAAHGTTTPSSAPPPPPASAQTVLPFTGLEGTHDVAVDTAGNVYVADTHYFKSDKGFPDATTRVIKLAAGSNSQTVLPEFIHAGLVADPAGAVWVVDARNEQLVKLAAGSDTQTVLPLPNLGVHGDIQTVDNAGNVYGANGGGVDSGGGCCVPVHVVKLAVGSNTPTVLPFAHINGDGGMAVDTVGNVYVGEYDNNRVLELAAGSDTPTVLPFTHLHGVIDIAVDAAGGVYVVDADHNRVVKLAAGSDTPTVLPFTGLNHPVSVAVDTAGDAYVVDGGNHRVLKLAAEQW
jgi:streptogramin lyase